MRLGNTVGDRINEFDNLEVRTVGMFNELFPECPLNYDPKLKIVIAGPATNNQRVILVDGKMIYHKMYSDILYTLDRQLFHLDDRDMPLDEINGVPV